MKGIILERRGDYAAVLREDGTVMKLRRAGEVGESVEVPAEVIAMPARRSWTRNVAAAALAVAVLGGAAAYVTVPASAYVSLDVGDSSIELGVNRIGRVVSVEALSGGAAELARSLDGETRGKRVEDALRRSIREFSDGGYLETAEGLVIAGVTADSRAQGERLAEAVDGAAAETAETEAPIDLYTLDVSPAERREAREQELSAGRWAFERRGGGREQAGPHSGAAPQNPEPAQEGAPAAQPA
ncbi:MAG: hypothetical protein IJ617_05790, partial [Oscillospiraceae bacterium]|nr:hypothetical protein [Oscillospiraceae bacterium]